jgi:hypothetical protein
MRGTKAKAIRRMQRACDHQSDGRYSTHPKTVQLPKCVKCKVTMGAAANTPDGMVPF